MSLKTGAHVEIGGVGYDLDEAYEADLGRRNYIHGGRDIFAEQFNITGIPGARNLRQEDLVWQITNFAGEGQVVMKADDETSATRFYRSEGIDNRVPGQQTLNRSSVSQFPSLAGAASTTYQGAADFADITGTSTTSGTDRNLDDVGDKVGTSANYAPGAGSSQVDFYLFRGVFEDNDTTVQGDALRLYGGTGKETGTNFLLKDGTAQTTIKSSGTHFTAGVQQRVEFTFDVLGETDDFRPITPVRVQVADVTRENHIQIVATDYQRWAAASGPNVMTLNFTPVAGKDYRFRIIASAAQGLNVLIDKIAFGPEEGVNTATIEVWNQTGGASVTTKIVEVNAEAAGALAGSITFTSAAATNYRFRVERTAGQQDIWVDQVTATDQGATVFVLDCIETGLGGRTWAGGHTAAADSKVWRYDPTDDRWEDSGGTLGEFATLNDGAATTNAVVLAMTHSDSLEYFLLNNGDVYSVTTAGVDDLYADTFTDAVGMAACQERLVVMTEGTGGITIYALPLDDGSTPVLPGDADVTSLPITAGSKTPNANLRQRMCSSPTGVRFFVNYGDATCKVYEADVSGSTITYRELADLGHGVEGYAIAYETGLTWITGQFVAESDQTPQSALWFIDANGVLERDLFFREDSPDTNPPIDIEPYQTNLWILQGSKVWRRSLTRGGLFLEYELAPTTSSEARSLAVATGRTWALYEDEIIVTGTESTYRQASGEGGNTHTSSIYDFGLPGQKKVLTTIKVLTKDMPAGAQIRVLYSLDGSSTFTEAGLCTSGAETVFIISSEENPTLFNTLQMRWQLISTNGTATPTLKAVIPTAQSADQQEYFDLVLRVEDQDSSDHPPDVQSTGAQLAKHLVSLWKSGIPVVFRDGYESKDPSEFTDYLVRVGDFRFEAKAQGEGRIVTTLKVIR